MLPFSVEEDMRKVTQDVLKRCNKKDEHGNMLDVKEC